MTTTDSQQYPTDSFPGLVGLEILGMEEGVVTARLAVEQRHLAGNGFMHAGAVVTLADTACGYGCMRTLPEGAVGFTTIELKSNFLGTITSGDAECKASMLHGGRTTQVWDATVTGGGRTLALFRCTQMVLYPR